jgi:3-deoxy-D-manno-octulosonic-acid transferase
LYFSAKINRLSLFFYNLFLWLYRFGINIASLWNAKAKKWGQGRKSTMYDVQSKMEKIRYSLLTTHYSPIIWMHCASVGEFEQGRPIIEKLKAENENLKIVLTFFSPSGYETCKNYKGVDAVFYLPMDSKKNAQQFLDAIKPTLVLWVKYEYWFYYLQELKRRNIPAILVSGIFRDNQPFFKWYGTLWKQMLHCFTFLFVQNEESKKLLSNIHIKENVVVSGDTRFDRVCAIADNFIALPLVEKFCGDSNVFVAGSTWEEDEEELIHYVKTHPQIKFIIAPHEVDESTIKDVQKEFPSSILYSQLSTTNHQPPTTNCLIIDNIGMLSRLYYYADVTYVGGGFGSDGVHNVLEAAVYGKPVLFGPVYQKYIEAVDLIECGAAICINDALQLEKCLNNLFLNANEVEKMGERAKKYVQENKGATEKIVNDVYENRLLIN